MSIVELAQRNRKPTSTAFTAECVKIHNYYNNNIMISTIDRITDTYNSNYHVNLWVLYVENFGEV